MHLSLANIASLRQVFGVDFTSFPLDTSPPITGYSLQGSQPSGGWYAGPVQVLLNAYDNPGGSGVAATYYTLDGGTQQTYGGPFTVDTAGSHTLTFYSVDWAGNTEPLNVLAFGIYFPGSISGRLIDGATGNGAPSVDIYISPPVQV